MQIISKVRSKVTLFPVNHPSFRAVFFLMGARKKKCGLFSGVQSLWICNFYWIIGINYSNADNWGCFYERGINLESWASCPRKLVSVLPMIFSTSWFLWVSVIDCFHTRAKCAIWMIIWIAQFEWSFEWQYFGPCVRKSISRCVIWIAQFKWWCRWSLIIFSHCPKETGIILANDFQAHPGFVSFCHGVIEASSFFFYVQKDSTHRKKTTSTGWILLPLKYEWLNRKRKWM